jgi:putative RNA 2'-phosphotransferase
MRDRRRQSNTQDTTAPLNYVSLSKAMSKALRHRPERLGLTLAADGSIELQTLIEALNSRSGWPRTITEADIMQVVDHGSKQRFAVEDGRIRARYGHSIPLAAPYEQQEPPALLFHGTTRERAMAIMEEGLLPMGRQVVHLSTDVETAMQVGRRHGSDVVVLRVDARRAWKEGVPFYRGNDSTWLADPIPPAYLTLE